jgi:ferritin
MFSKTLNEEMNTQIKLELYSAYLYLSMSAHFEAVNLGGFAHWMRLQAGEEQGHAMKFFDYIQERNGKIALQAIDQPPVEFTTPIAIFEQVLKHEESVTGRINHLYELALKDNDYASQVFLQWFITEQVEEEKNASDILATLKIIGEKSNAIFQLDHRLEKRE